MARLREGCTCTTSIRAVDAFIPSHVTTKLARFNITSCFRGYRRLLHPCYCRSSFVVSVVSSSSFRTFVLRLVMYRTYTHCHLTTCDDWSEVHMPSAWGRAELRAGAAAVAIVALYLGSARYSSRDIIRMTFTANRLTSKALNRLDLRPAIEERGAATPSRSHSSA